MATVAYPKIPESNWWKLRDQFKKTLPTIVTTAYLKSLLGFNSEGAAQNLIGPLRQMGLIDDAQKPTGRANDWRSDAKYGEVCEAILADVYPQELRDLYGGPDLDRHAVETWFMDNAALGQAAAARNTHLYVLLNDATPQSSENKPADAKPRSTRAATARKPRGNATSASTQARGSQTPSGGTPADDSTRTDGPAIHLDFQIHITPEAGPEQIDAIFAAMAKHFPNK